MPAKIVVAIVYLAAVGSFLPSFGQSQQSLPQLTFKLVYCGQGFFNASNAYEASDGTVVTTTDAMWRSDRAARADFNRHLHQIPTVTHDSRILDGSGNTIGRKVTGVLTQRDGSSLIIVLTQKGRWVTQHTAASFGHLQALSDWLQQQDPANAK